MYSCEKDPISENTIPVISTGKATGIGNTSATLNIIVNEGRAVVKSGMIFGSHSDLSASESHVYEYESSVPVIGLKKNTLYYFKAYAVDDLGNFIYGDVSSFRTKDLDPSVRTEIASYESYDFKLIDFYPRIVYEFTDYFNVCASLVANDKVLEWGVCVSDENDFLNSSYFYFPYLQYYYEGSVEKLRLQKKTTSPYSFYIYYRAYAKLLNGNYIYGDIKTVMIPSHKI